jgi:hypothetical protein
LVLISRVLVSQVSFWLVVVRLLLLFHPILVGNEAKCRRYLSSILKIRSLSPVFSPGQHTEAIQDLVTRSKEREEERARSKRAKIEQEKNKEDRENRRLSLEEARLRLDNERLEMERAERTASMQFMQALAQSLLNRNNNNNTNNNNN